MKTNYRKHAKTIIVTFLIIVLLAFSTNKGYNLYKGLLTANRNIKDSLIEDSRRKQDSLLLVIENGILISETLTQKINNLNKSNRYLYRKLKKREKDLLIIDTSFIVNAKRITKRSYRHRKENDTTQ